MNLKNFKIVLKKELKDLFRDKKSLIATFFIPIVLYPLLMFLMGGGMQNMMDGSGDINVAVLGVRTESGYTALAESDKKLFSDLFDGYNQSVTEGQKIYIKEFDDYDAALVDGGLQVIITAEAGIGGIESQATGGYTVGYVSDQRSNNSMLALSVIQNVIETYAKAVYDQRISGAIGGDISGYQTILQGEALSVDDFVKRSGTDNYLIIMMIPMLVTVLISVGGATVAVDLIAGEKERGTFEPLLSTGAGRFSILSAKYLVVIIFALINGIVQVLAMAAGIALSPSLSHGMGGESGLSLSFGGVVLGAVNILLLACFFCSVMLCLASTAKNFKEASTKTSFLVLLPMLLAFSVMFTDAVNIGISNMFIPIINVVCVIKMILSGYINYSYFFISAAVNLALVGAAVYITLKMFSKESLISRS